MNTNQKEVAVFGGGCFWCTEAVFEQLKGITALTSGYAGGQVENPSYYDVVEDKTGHAEVIKIEFDPTIITYEQLLEVFFAVHDPTSLNRQGADVGAQYRSIILFTTPQQQKSAAQMIATLQKSGTYQEKIVTEIVPFDTFYSAEEYHQRFYDKNPDSPYCQVVVQPKVETVLAKFKSLLK